MELLAVLLALLVLATPVLAISAVWRQRKLRLRVEELAHQTSQQNDALHRELLDLRRQVGSLSPSASPSAHPDASGPAVSGVTSKPPQPATVERSTEPLVKTAPVVPGSAQPPAPAAKAEPVLCPWCSTVHAGVNNCPPKPDGASYHHGRLVKDYVARCREIAHNGTVLLDEIGDLDPHIQPKLLKVFPLDFSRFEVWFAGVERRALAIGDYPIAGLEEIRVVERKDLPDVVHSFTADRAVFVEIKEDERMLAQAIGNYSGYERGEVAILVLQVQPQPSNACADSHSGGMGGAVLVHGDARTGGGDGGVLPVPSSSYNWLEANSHGKYLVDGDL